MALPCIDCTMAFWQGVWLLVLLLQATSLPSISAIQGASSSASSSPPPMQVLPRWRWGLSSTPLHADTELRGDRTRSLSWTRRSCPHPFPVLPRPAPAPAALSFICLENSDLVFNILLKHQPCLREISSDFPSVSLPSAPEPGTCAPLPVKASQAACRARAGLGGARGQGLCLAHLGALLAVRHAGNHRYSGIGAGA